MSATTFARKRLTIAFALLLVVSQGKLCADEVLSNLGVRWVDPANPGVNDIGDIHALGPFTVHFFTGENGEKGSFAVTPSSVTVAQTGPLTGLPTNAASFQLNWVTFEFIGVHLQPWNEVRVDLYQQVGSNGTLVGELSIPALDPRPTQWPESRNPPWFCTTYVDYLPAKNIYLQPASEYYVSLSPNGSDFGLLFGLSSNYAAASGWRMGPTFTQDPWAAGEFIKFAVDATANIGASSSGSTGLSNVCLSATKMGTNVLLRWPASPYTLYSTESVESKVWQTVAATPLRSNTDLLLSLPFTNVMRCFRLKAP